MKYIKNNYFFIGLVTLLVAATAWTVYCWQSKKQDSLADIKSRGVLRVSTMNSALTWHQINNQTTGIDYELAKRFADSLGVKLEVTVRPNLQMLFNDLKHDHADFIAAGLSWSNTRDTQYQAGPSYYNTTLQLVYRVDKPKPISLDRLSGSLAVPADSSFASALAKQQAAHYPDLDWRAEQQFNTQQMLRQVVEGKLDYTLADSATLSMVQRIYPQLAVAFDVESNVPVNWYLRKNRDNSLNLALIDFFQKMEQEHVLARLEEKYLGHGSHFDYVDTRSFLQAIDKSLAKLQPVFKKYANNVDWQLLAAMAWQESHWDPNATSPTGVRGMMMLTKVTASSLDVENRLDVEQSVRGGSQYLQTLIQRLPTSIHEDERVWFALAAYNMGFAHLLDARKLTADQGGDPDSWCDVKTRLPLLAIKRFYAKTTYGYARGHEAYAYVENIRRYNISLVGYLQATQSQGPHLLPRAVLPKASKTEPQLAMN